VHANLLRRLAKTQPLALREDAGDDEGQERSEQLGVLEVGKNGLGDAGILNLYGHGAAVVQPRLVDLADGRGCERPPFELGERDLDPLAELCLDHLPCQL